jgi:hypothetical protein
MGLSRAESQTIELRAELVAGGESAARTLGALEFVVDGRVAGRSDWPYQLRIPATPGDHEVLAPAADGRPRGAPRADPLQRALSALPPRSRYDDSQGSSDSKNSICATPSCA